MAEEKEEKEVIEWGEIFGHAIRNTDFDLEFINDDFGVYG